MPKSYKDLIAWQKAMNLVTDVYLATKAFPKEELFCLTSQLRRAAISIPSNIAEGSGRSTHTDRSRFLFQARGSTLELQTQVEIAARLRYIRPETAEKLNSQANEVGRIINGLLKAAAAIHSRGEG